MANYHKSRITWEILSLKQRYLIGLCYICSNVANKISKLVISVFITRIAGAIICLICLSRKVQCKAGCKHSSHVITWGAASRPIFTSKKRPNSIAFYKDFGRCTINFSRILLFCTPKINCCFDMSSVTSGPINCYPLKQRMQSFIAKCSKVSSDLWYRW